jgi:hypothetical protein
MEKIKLGKSIVAALSGYVPPFPVILRLLRIENDQQTISDQKQVTVPFGLLRLLLRGSLAARPFDEERYLRANPDVAAAVVCGEVKSGQDHFINIGYFEGRDGAEPEFAESWYLRSNSDVANAIRLGQWRSAHEHFRAAGAFELRAPNGTIDAELALWRTLFKNGVNSAEALQAEPS